MPYIIRPRWLPPTAVAACSALLAFGAGAAQAAPQAPPQPQAVDTSSCQAPVLSQPFLSAGDTNDYMLAPGQSEGQFNGAGWALSGDASIMNAALPQGGSGSVLDLPSGAKAVSPLVCVNAFYPTARMRVRDVAGAEGVSFYVSYQGTPSQNKPKNTGQVHVNGSSWTLSAPVNMQPNRGSAWELVRITLIAGGHSSDFQLDDLYIDPYSR